MEKRIESLRQQISTMEQLIAAYENKITLISEENKALIATASKASGDKTRLQVEIDRLAVEVELLQSITRLPTNVITASTGLTKA